MPDDREAQRPASSDQDRTGAFIVRAWRTDHEMRIRIRSALDLSGPEHLATVGGEVEATVADAVDRFRRWLEAFANDAPMTPP